MTLRSLADTEQRFTILRRAARSAEFRLLITVAPEGRLSRLRPGRSRESSDRSRRHADGGDKDGSPNSGRAADIHDRISRQVRAPDCKRCSEGGSRGYRPKLARAESWEAPVHSR